MAIRRQPALVRQTTPARYPKNPEALQRPAYSQKTIRWPDCKSGIPQTHRVFAGCENVFDFRQLRPILGWEQPFARGFDPSFAWGPTRGREFYAGFNFKIPKKTEQN
ncbi:MAG: hypothetical protein IPL27_00230 [Lewinellaceae bacterium]|nr:hypothetical protein [Lewinellaceae bacterium]